MKMNVIELYKTAKEYGIESNEEEIILKELRKKMLEIHPDKFQGEFPNDETKERFHKLQELLDSQEQANNALIPISAVKDLIAYSQNINKDSKEVRLETKLKDSINDYEPDIGRRAKLPKISLTALTTIISFLWLFPGQISEHPILSELISTDSMFFTVFWIVLIFYTLMFWILGMRNENREKYTLRQIKTERFQGNLFEEFIDWCKRENKESFKRSELISFTGNRVGKRRHSPMNMFFSSSIDEQIFENLANLIISKAEQKQLIEIIDGTGFEDKFEIKTDTNNRWW